jgi:signal peptidase
MVMVAPLFGWHFSVVAGGSMEPTIGFGSVAVIQPVEGQDVAVGDIIAFAPPSAPGSSTIHRVVGVEQGGGSVQFRTKGDANDSPDPNLVPAQNVRGRVCLYVPHLGSIINGMRSTTGRALLFGIPAGVIILLELKSIIGVVRGWRVKTGG